MRILLTSGIYPPDIGGPATYIPKLAQKLSEQGFEVTVITLRNKNSNLGQSSIWKVKYVDRNLNPIIRSARLIWLIRRNASQSDYIFSNGLYIETFMATLFSRKRKVAKIVGDPVWERVTNKGLTTRSIEDFAIGDRSIRAMALRKIYNFSFNSYEEISAPSSSLAELIQKWGIKKDPAVISNGVSCQKATTNISENQAICVSRLVKWKRVDMAIRACALIKMKLVIVGDGPEMESLQALAKTVGCKAEFIGHVSHEYVRKLIAQSEIFIQLSEYEGLSFSLLEAMMEEKRILVSSAKGNAQVIDHQRTGLVVDNSDLISIVDGLESLRNGGTTITRMQAQARIRATKHYCEDSQMQKMIKLIIGRN